jgi:hypothetical protein
MKKGRFRGHSRLAAMVRDRICLAPERLPLFWPQKHRARKKQFPKGREPAIFSINPALLYRWGGVLRDQGKAGVTLLSWLDTSFGICCGARRSVRECGFEEVDERRLLSNASAVA